MAAAARAFSPQWLAAHLAALLPGYPDVSLCVALSGGVDSLALLAALAAGPHPRSRLRAVHVDHGIHPDSHTWAAQCRVISRRLQVPLTVKTRKVVKVRGASLEALAREARYSAFAEQLRAGEVLLTAQHADDQLETVLLQLLRGSGLAGLAAMPALAPFAKGWLARPLLPRTRAELQSWVRSRELSWIEDESNADERLDRNYLRRRVLPAMRDRWPGAARAVARTARHAAEAQRLLDLLARADVESAADGEALSVKTLRALDADRRRNALRFWIAQSGHRLPDARRLEEIAGPVIDARHDANPRVTWDTTVVQRHADVLSIRTIGVASGREVVPWSWNTTYICELPGDRGSVEIVPDARGPIDLDAVPALLEVRARTGGERLRPQPRGRRRALKSLLQEARIPVEERKRIPLVFAGERLIAAADLWVDASVRADAGALRRARLRWHR